MGAIPAAGDLVVVKLLSTCGGEPCINDLSLQIENPAASWAEQVMDVVSGIGAAIGPAGTAFFNVGKSTAFNTYAAQVVDARPNTSPLAEVLLGWQGDIADDVMPPNDSLCVTLRTDVKGRTGRGRVYFNGYPEGGANGGYWEAATQLLANNVAQALLDEFGTANLGRSYTWGVISRYEFGVKREIPAFTAITSYSVHNEVRSLRRRAVGVRISRHRTAA
jgi:hypothetical protein